VHLLHSYTFQNLLLSQEIQTQNFWRMTQSFTSDPPISPKLKLSFSILCLGQVVPSSKHHTVIYKPPPVKLGTKRCQVSCCKLALQTQTKGWSDSNKFYKYYSLLWFTCCYSKLEPKSFLSCKNTDS